MPEEGASPEAAQWISGQGCGAPKNLMFAAHRLPGGMNLSVTVGVAAFLFGPTAPCSAEFKQRGRPVLRFNQCSPKIFQFARQSAFGDDGSA
jgi:hypothetical protein